MREVQYFKAVKSTNRFRENQKVWIRQDFANHLWIRFKYRGKGRYVNGTIDRLAPAVGELKTIEVDDEFGDRILYGDLEQYR